METIRVCSVAGCEGPDVLAPDEGTWPTCSAVMPFCVSHVRLQPHVSIKQRAAIAAGAPFKPEDISYFSAALVLALLSAFLALPVTAQDLQSVPPAAPVASPEPSKKEPKLNVMFEAGPSSISTPAAEGVALAHPTIELFATARVNAVYEHSPRLRFLGYGELDRVTDGRALTIADFDSVRAARGKVAVLYRIKDTPVSIGAAGGLSWSLQNGVLRDPNIWDFGAIVCLERFQWWPNGGLACLGGGRWEGRDGVRFEVRQPIAGQTFATYVNFTVPFTKLPEFVSSLQGVATAVPLHGGPPTAEELRGVQQRLPVSVSVGGLLTIKTFSR